MKGYTNTGGGSATVRYDITATAGSNGVISPSGTTQVKQGTNKLYTFTPNTGYELDELRVDGVVTTPTTANTYEFINVQAGHSIYVTFKVKTFTVTPVVDGACTITPNTAQTVNYGASVQFTYAAAAGGTLQKVEIDGVQEASMPGTYTFTNVVADHTIKVTASTVTFTLTSTAGTNGTINPLGTTTINYGASQNYTITPDTNYQIDTLTVDGVATTPVTTYTFSNVTANHTIDVTFKATEHTITATAGANGTITPSGAVGVSHGSNKTFTISPATGYEIDALKVDGATVTSATTYTFTNVTADHTIDVTFKRITYDIVASAGSNGTITPSGTVVVNHGDNQSFTIAANTGYEVDTLTVDGTAVTSATSYTFTNVVASHTISVTFKQIVLTITATAGSNGTISPSGATSVNYGGTQRFDFTPSTGYEIDTVTVDGTALTTKPLYYEFTNVTSNHTVAVTFKILTFKITSSAGANGTITPNGDTTVNYGANQSYTITPATNYMIDTLTVDGTAVTSPTTTYTFSNVTATHTISVTFKVASYTIAISAGANGTTSPSGNQTVALSGNLTITVNPNSGYTVDTVTSDGTAVTLTNNQYTYSNVTSDHTFAVTFKVIPYYSFTVGTGSDPTDVTFHDTAMSTEAQRLALFQQHAHLCTVGDDGKITHTLSWTDATKDATSGATVNLTTNNVFLVFDSAFYKTTTETSGVKYWFSFTSVAPEASGWTSTTMLNGTPQAYGAGIGVFAGLNQSGTLMSINSSAIPTVSQTQNTFYTQAVNGRTGTFNINFPPLITFYKIMLIFVKGNRNTQAAYGNGIVGASTKQANNLNWSATSPCNNGDTSGQASGVTALGVHNFWGNIYEFMGEEKIGATADTVGFATDWGDHQSIETAGIKSTWHTVAGQTSSGYISAMASDSADPFIPSAVSGSSSTYWCDYGYGSTSTERCVVVGGAYYNVLKAGAFCWGADNTVDYSAAVLGSRLCVLISAP